MAIRHAVRENRLSDPSAATAADCTAFTAPEIWVWEENGEVHGFAAGDARDGPDLGPVCRARPRRGGIGRALLPLACATLLNASSRRHALPYSALSTKSLSAPDSAPQTSPLRPASCRTPA